MKTYSLKSVPLLFFIACASNNASAACNYDNADQFNGWGWNPATALSCRPREDIVPLNNIADATGLSQNGRYVVYEVSGPSTQNTVFMHDRDSNTTKVISIDPDGRQIEGHDSVISGDGNYVAFIGSEDHIIASGDGGGFDQHAIYVYETATGQSTELTPLSYSSTRVAGSAPLMQIDFSGNYIAYRDFDSGSGTEDVRVMNRITRESVLASIDEAGNPIEVRMLAMSADGRKIYTRENIRTDRVYSYDAQSATATALTLATDLREFSTSLDGRLVAFTSSDSNLVASDTNNGPDAFVYDTGLNTMTRVSVSSNGDQADGYNYQGTLPASTTRLDINGRYVSFVSPATNLVDDRGSGRVFLHDRTNGITTRVSDRSGTVISANGIVVNYDDNATVYGYSLGSAEPGPLASECVDSDGDGWGWDGTNSCIVTSPVTPPESRCVDTPPLNDGWGWNGAESCRIAPVTLVCVDSVPLNDGWGWNGVESCRI